MKLFANGCSFTHGHKDWKDDFSASDWVWPSVMSPMFEETVNMGWCGGSNQRILRTTLEFFDNIKNKSEWIAVIQWTDCYSRHELHDEKTDTYLGYIVSNDSSPVLDKSSNRKFVTIPSHINRAIELYHNTTMIRSKLFLETQLLTQQFILSEYFKKFNIKYLFAGMSHSSFVSNDLDHPLMKVFSRENNILAFSALINHNMSLRENETDWHPNKAGHAVIANYITNELKARNYL